MLGDGEKVLAEGFPFFGTSEATGEPGEHTLSRNSTGASGGGQNYVSSDRLWLYPLPPEGPIEFVMQWLALGVDERRVVLDGSAMRALASRVQRFWD